MTSSFTRRLAWTFGAFGAALSVFTFVFGAAVGVDRELVTPFLGALFGVLMAVLGAMIAARQPRNSIGWLMLATAIAVCMVTLPLSYAYGALVVHHGSWPAGTAVLWISTWASIPVFSLALPLIIARFPDGKLRPRWRFIDWLAITGTVVFGGSLIFAKSALPLSDPSIDRQLAPFEHGPWGFALPDFAIQYLYMVGLVAMIATFVVASASLLTRFRHASHEESSQLKWFVYSGVLLTATAVYAGVAWWNGQVLDEALVPFAASLVTLPLAIGIAILRYRLFDIDLIINRTLVYLGLTAALGALYTALVTFLNRFFIGLTGQKSDAAYVLTAFAVVAAFGPIKDWLQRMVDRRLGGATASKALERFIAEVDSVVAVIDVNRVACRLVDRAAVAFDARGAALYLQSNGAEPIYSRGLLNGDAAIEVSLRYDGRDMGRLVLGSRRGDVPYSAHDRDALQRSADSVGEALAIASRFGGVPATTR